MRTAIAQYFFFLLPKCPSICRLVAIFFFVFVHLESQGLIYASAKSNLIKSLRRSSTNIQINHENSWKFKMDSKQEEATAVVKTERPRHSRSNSEEIAKTSESVFGLRSRAPRVQKPSSSSSLSPSISVSSALSSFVSSPSYNSISDLAEQALTEMTNITE